ncbi:MAG: nitrogen regulation protein NR(II) [Haloarculaceae archaeon]
MTDDPNDGEHASEVESGEHRSAPRERYRKIFEHSNDAIMVVDLETEEFLDVNPKACELLGYPRSELLSKHPEDIHPDDIDRVREEFISQVVEEDAGFTDDVTCLTRDGERIPTEISGAALYPSGSGSEDPPTRMVAMLRDVSDRVRHRRELEETVERLDRFASLVSHDLRNPVSVIKGHVTLARETGDPEHFDAIEDAADRMDEMLSDLLELTRQGDLVGERTTVDLEPLAREVWADCGIGSATLVVESSVTVRADRDRFRELLANLFENAIAHGGESVTVRVGALGTDWEGFYVADDGVGIPVGERSDVFEWGHTTTDDGTGFGLAIVAEIVEAHGWRIEVRESADGGARFDVDFS